MRTAFVPLRRVAIQYVMFGVVVATGGFVESWGSSLALVVLVVCVPFGVWADRSEKRTLAQQLPSLAPGVDVLEGASRTALRTLGAMGLFAVAVVIGVFQPVIGAVGGGAVAGIAVSRLYSFRRLVRTESHLGCRLIVQVPAGLRMRKKLWTPMYYRDRP